MQLGDSGLLEVARESGISVDSVRRWVKQSERDQGSRQDGPRGSERKGWCARGGRTVGCGWSGKSCQRPFEFVKANQALYPIAKHVPSAECLPQRLLQIRLPRTRWPQGWAVWVPMG